MTITPARQRNSVSEGMAFGLVLNGHTSIPHEKMNVDLSFAGAFRSWDYASRFPQVAADLRNGTDGIHVLTHATDLKRVWALYWETEGRNLVIYARQSDWDPNDPVDIEYTLGLLAGDVPLEGWKDFAERFIRRMQR